MRIWANETFQEFREDRLAVIGAVAFLVALVLAIYPNLLATQNPYDLAGLDLSNSLKSPGPHFWLGTDEQGRDIFSAIVYGLRISLFVGITATILSSALGLTAGLVAGYRGGFWTRP